MATINGTSKNEALAGSGSADVIYGAGGNDILYGVGGADILDGGTGNDALKAGVGNDILHGRSGNDKLSGHAGADILRGGSGNDLLDGGSGHDRLFGGDGNDILCGRSGDDLLIGNDGQDSFHGGDGNDVIVVGPALPVDVDGGNGIDRVKLDALGASIDLSGSVGSGFTDIEKIDLRGCTANTLRLDAQSVLDMAGGSGGIPNKTLLVKGDAGDVVSLMGSWTRDATPVGACGETGSFISYTCGQVQVLVESDVTVGTDSFAELDLAALNGTNGFRLVGVDAFDASGFSVASAGDVNGDGFDDMIVGALFAGSAGGADGGESYVVFGKANWGSTPSLDLAALDGTNGFSLVGTDAYDLRGISVSSAGDVNGDGFDDLILGAPGGDSGSGYEVGESYVVFGKASWATTPSVDLTALDGVTGVWLTGVDEGDVSGRSVSSAGDLNGDGFADLLIGAPGADSGGYYYSEGESYVVFGKESWAGTPSLDLASLDGNNGIRLLGIEGFSGITVSSAGDVNGDGFDDVIIRAQFAYVDGIGFSGQGYVVFGQGDWAGTPTLNLASLDGANGFALNNIDTLYSSGHSIASAGDVNGDGFDDLVIGSPYGAYDSGESYVVFGKASWSGVASVDLASVDGVNGFALLGIKGNDNCGWSVASAGDVNGDGFDDVIVGAPQLGNDFGYGASSGESYVVFGKANWAETPALDLAALDGSNGFRLIGVDIYDASGISVSSAGDVNGDGFADMIVGAPDAESTDDGYAEGESYVVFGGNFAGAVTHLGGAGDDMLTGNATAETFVGGTGNDTLIGNGGVDAFQGGAGDDIIRVSSLDFLLADGGSGEDMLALNGAGLHLDLTTLADSRTRSLERVDIGGDGDNTLTLSVLDVLNFSDDTNELLVLGGVGDVVNRGAGWLSATSGGTNGDGTSTIGGQTYQIYQAGQAVLLVDMDMTASA